MHESRQPRAEEIRPQDEIAKLKDKIDGLKWWIIGSVILGTTAGGGIGHLLPILMK